MIKIKTLSENVAAMARCAVKENLCQQSTGKLKMTIKGNKRFSKNLTEGKSFLLQTYNRCILFSNNSDQYLSW